MARLGSPSLRLSALPVPAGILTAEGRVEAANAPLARFLGLSEEGAVGADLFSLLHLPDEARTERSRLQGYLASDPPAPRTRPAPPGAGTWIDLPLRAARGRPPRALRLLLPPGAPSGAPAGDGADEDLTGFHSTILEHIPDMVFVKDARDLRFVRFNRAGEQLLGLKREDLIGRSDADFFPPDEAAFFLAKDREVLERGGIIEIPEEPIHTRHRGTRILHTKKIAVRGADGQPTFLVGISEDITERKEAERALARQAELLAQKNRDLEQFAWFASHDLQEPLRKVRQFGELLQAELDPARDATALDHLRRMQRATRRMQGIIEDLLALARIHGATVNNDVIDLNRLVDQVWSELREDAREPAARMTRGELPRVWGDEALLRLLLENLLRNALKFRSKERPCAIRITARARPDGRQALRIEDNGIGFPPEQAATILQPFQRLHGHDAYEGSGIGLAICQRVAERHGGGIEAEGHPGQGAAFTIDLPVAP